MVEKRKPFWEEGAEDHDVDILGLYLAEVARIPPLSPEEERELARRMREGDIEARNRLVLAHLRLVVSIAREYGDTGLDLLDLIQEGNIGLLEAAARFDPEKGFRFSTYARWWIRQAIGAAIERQSQLIRIPAYLFRALVRWAKLKASFGDDGISETVDTISYPGLTVERLRELERTIGEVVSLDMPVGAEGEETLEELVADEKMPTTEKLALQELMREELLELISQLPPKEALVIRLRYGLEGAKPQSLAEVAAKLGVSRERVRQLEKQALKRLKAWTSEALEYYRRLVTA
ncbi:RNA polymerase sigma factor RpoD/SigA [Candidatus Bipolaricaulota bacterium]|nr:RNA polymerase sigma factor RpoD/SigA [Candidatus Bipolaricaulota bacterium]